MRRNCYYALPLLLTSGRQRCGSPCCRPNQYGLPWSNIYIYISTLQRAAIIWFSFFLTSGSAFGSKSSHVSSSWPHPTRCSSNRRLDQKIICFYVVRLPCCNLAVCDLRLVETPEEPSNQPHLSTRKKNKSIKKVLYTLQIENLHRMWLFSFGSARMGCRYAFD